MTTYPVDPSQQKAAKAAGLSYLLTFALVVMGYLVSGPVLWLRQRRTA